MKSQTNLLTSREIRKLKKLRKMLKKGSAMLADLSEKAISQSDYVKSTRLHEAHIAMGALSEDLTYFASKVNMRNVKLGEVITNEHATYFTTVPTPFTAQSGERVE